MGGGGGGEEVVVKTFWTTPFLGVAQPPVTRSDL